MNDEQKAWRLWQLLQEVSDALWDCNERVFLDFCKREHEQYRSKKAASVDSSVETKDGVPF